MKGYEQTGVISINDLRFPSKKHFKKGVAVIECIQRIPCDPCVDACPVNAISMNDINDPPVIDYDRCTGCGTCIAVCPGLAIFLVKIQGDEAFVSLPYEFLPIPKVGEKVEMLDREGKKRGEAEVMKVKKIGKTAVITVAVDKNLAMEVRNIRVKQV